MEPPAKRAKRLLEDSDSESDSGNESGGVLLRNGTADGDATGFKINEEYARRFEHNKKREELQKLEEKHGKNVTLGKRKQTGDDDEGSGSDEDSESEDEDDMGELATEALDTEIMATLKAIRSKDPRVYDGKTAFYTPMDENNEQPETSEKKDKPMYLRDYHRENLLKTARGDEDDGDEDAPKTFAQEQEDLKKSVIREMHAAADGDKSDDSEDEGADDDFLVRKHKEVSEAEEKEEPQLDVENADKDPETFLSNFLSARAWVPSSRSRFQPFESDDEEEEEKAEAFEEAYNFRFEDPNKINERLITHARDTTSKYSVRRDEVSGRKKKRDAEKKLKEEESQQRDTERARLRKLKMEEVEEKIKKIKQAAGTNSVNLTDEDWAHFLEDGWDDSKWEKEMQKRFGEDYYAEQDVLGSGAEDEASSSKKKKPKKPKWDDDIDIKDLVPDFDDEEGVKGDRSDAEMEDADDDAGEGSSKSKKSRAQEIRDRKREERKERRKIEQVVDQSLDLEASLLPGSKKHSGFFRYRETSPTSYGLTARDILMADDGQLNQFVGLKKLATFRDEEKKRKDKKKMGKKARLRQWRQETFGNEDGPPEQAFTAPAADENAAKPTKDEMAVDIREGGKKKRKRSKKH